MKTRKYACIDCGKVKLINAEKNDYEKYVAKYPRCHSCGAKKAESKLKGTWFKGGEEPWNKGTKGAMKKNTGSIKKGERRSKETEFKYKNGFGYRAKLIYGKGAKCVICGESQENRLHVHHKDGDRTNNNFNNLEILCRPHHLEKHGRKERVYVEGRARA